MDIDEALEHVLLGEVVQRLAWGPDDVIVKWWDKEGQIGWRSTRLISCPDMVADDWRVVGRVQ